MRTERCSIWWPSWETKRPKYGNFRGKSMHWGWSESAWSAWGACWDTITTLQTVTPRKENKQIKKRIDPAEIITSEGYVKLLQEKQESDQDSKSKKKTKKVKQPAAECTTKSSKSRKTNSTFPGKWYLNKGRWSIGLPPHTGWPVRRALPPLLWRWLFRRAENKTTVRFCSKLHISGRTTSGIFTACVYLQCECVVQRWDGIIVAYIHGENICTKISLHISLWSPWNLEGKLC